MPQDRPGPPEEGATWGRPGARPGAPRAQDQLADQGVTGRATPAASTVRAVQTWVDQTIAQAQRQGAFDNLPGAGRPLRDVDPRADPDWWVKGLIEREQLDLSGALPGVMQLRREKATFPDALLDLPDETAVRARLEDFNERVLADRRRPYAGSGSPPVVGRVDVDAMVQRWRRLLEERQGVDAERLAAAEGGHQDPRARADEGSHAQEDASGRSPVRRVWWWRR